MKTYHLAIKEINPNAEFTILGDGEKSLDNINWLNGTTPIAKEDIIAKQNEMDIRDAHIGPRRKAYALELGSWDKQLGMIFDDFDSWKAAIQTIKDKYPKEE
tara:strand:+ start:308 stop:613 length:306 start_codon:yes stop_codon:yes gene_type:complete